MSGGKDGVAHRLLDQMAKLEAKVNGKLAEQAKVINTVVDRHNQLAAGMAALEEIMKNMAGFTASELGKMQAMTEKNIGILDRSIYGVDYNVIALSMLLKEVVGQLVQADTYFKKLHSTTKNLLSNQYGGLNDDGQAKVMTPEMIEEFKNALELTEEEKTSVREDSMKWYKELVKSSFAAAKQQMEKQEAEARAQAAKEKAEAEAAAAKAEAEQTEKTAVESELKAAAEAERSIVANKSGGPGSAFPDGADIFGG